MRADGSSPRPLTAFLAEGDTPCWSPDGSEIVFSGEPNDSIPGTAWVVRADGAQLHPLNLKGQFPSFLADANSLVVVNEHAERNHIGSEIAIANRDGTAVREITASANYKRSPRMTPDGRSILFALDPKRKVYNDNFADGGSSWEIWMIDRDGDNPRRIAFADLAR